MRHLALLGSTGSIGTSTLDVVAAHPDRLKVAALAAGRNRELFRAQCERFRPACVSLARAEDAAWLAREFTYRPGRPARHGRAHGLRPGGRRRHGGGGGGGRGRPGQRGGGPAQRAAGLRGQQGKPGGGRRPHAPGPGRGRRRAAADRFRALRPAPAPGRPGARGRAGDAHHRQRRPVPGLGPGAIKAATVAAGPQPSHLEDGPQDHHRLRHPHEQGPGGDRGLGAVRPGRGPDPGDRAPPEPGARHGRVPGRHLPACRCAPTT